MEPFTGGCLCGDVRIVATGRPYRVGLCHCLDCRKHHGALFHASAIFPQDAVTIEGETRDYAGRFFCHRFRGGRLCAVHMLIGRGRGLGLARSRDNLDELIDAHFECANLFLKIHA